MPAQKPEVKFALQFPQGDILCMKSDSIGSNNNSIGGVYFQPKDSAEAFMVWGERKELFGKNAITVGLDRETGAGGYSVVYEFNDTGALTDARLVSKTETLRGTLADDKTVASLNAALQQDAIKLYKREDTALTKVFNVASFPDGKLLIQLFNRNELYIGTPGNYAKVDASLAVQGGNSMYYRTPDGGSIDLPYSYGGPGRNDVPTFKGEELKYLNVESGADPAKFGLQLDGGVKHLDPFSPQLKSSAPKPPKL
ncbi:MAG: hypothetical protein PW788_12960 [Micavibrio sp.]|nr:hypothetical protein [Micavibrio sp.]